MNLRANRSNEHVTVTIVLKMNFPRYSPQGQQTCINNPLIETHKSHDMLNCYKRAVNQSCFKKVTCNLNSQHRTPTSTHPPESSASPAPET